MLLQVIERKGSREEGYEGFTLDELAREGARRMLVKALEVDVAQYRAAHMDERDEQGHAPGGAQQEPRPPDLRRRDPFNMNR